MIGSIPAHAVGTPDAPMTIRELLGSDLAWVKPSAALCAQTDPDLFHPEEQGTNSGAAKKVCRACPLLDACLQYALETEPHVWGVWGGTTYRERIRLRRGQTVRLVKPRRPSTIQCGTEAGYRRHVRVLLDEPCQPCLNALWTAQWYRHAAKESEVVDDVLVAQAIRGDVVTLNRAEKLAAVTAMLARGLGPGPIGEALRMNGVTTGRYVALAKQQMREAA